MTKPFFLIGQVIIYEVLGSGYLWIQMSQLWAPTYRGTILLGSSFRIAPSSKAGCMLWLDEQVLAGADLN